MQYNFFLRSTLNLNIFKIFFKFALCLIYSAALFALPDVNQVTNGEVSIVLDGNKALQINQNTDKAIVNWNNFNIDANEKVHFQQPVNGVCLNRIDATNGMSQINGSLSSTGKIFLINQAGILFGKKAQVNVGGIIASAIDITDDNFINNKFIFDQTSAQPGAIINTGVINVADEGIAVLLGASVSNEGIIQTKMSKVALASGDEITIDFYGNDVLIFGIDAPTSAAGVDENGNSLPSGVNVSGKIINDGGHVFITAKAAQGVFDNLINMSGVVRARTVTQEAGEIILLGYDGSVKVTGEFDVSGPGELDQAGTIRILGEHLIVDDYADFKVSAGAGQAGIYIGSKSIDSGLLSGIPFFLTPTKTVYVGSGVKFDAHAANSGYGCVLRIRSDFDITFKAFLYASGKDFSVFDVSSTNNMPSMSTINSGGIIISGGSRIISKSIYINPSIIRSSSPIDQYLVKPIYKLYQWIFS